MKLKTFINNFIEPNSLIRLWKPSENSNYEIFSEKVFMEWELLKDNKVNLLPVLGVKDILILDGNYREAINLVLDI